MGGLANLTADEVQTMVIAYEPVWAIGTGNSATTKDVEAAVRTIRHQIDHLYGRETAELVRVIYGGSVSSVKAREYLQTPGVDGLLPVGASLKSKEFEAIIEAAFEVGKK